MSQLAHPRPAVLGFPLRRPLWLAAALAVAAVALVLVLSDGSDRTPAATGAATAGAVRYDGGPEEGTSGLATHAAGPSVRYDGGPEEGGRGIRPSSSVSSAPVSSRYDGGPEEGSRGPGR